MLPTPYHWLDNPDTCYLCFNYQTVAVLKLEAGRVAGTLNWQSRVHTFRVGSSERASRWSDL